MSVIAAVCRFLEKRQVEFKLAPSTGADARSLQSPNPVSACAVVLCEAGRLCLAVYPEHASFNLAKLNHSCKRFFSVLENGLAPIQLKGLDRVRLFPVGEWYGLKTIVDKSLFGDNDVIIPSGDGRTQIRLGQSAFRKLFADAIPLEISDLTDAGVASPVRERISKGLRTTQGLPAVSPALTSLVTLLSKDDIALRELSAIAEQDPVIAARLISLARSSFFAYRGNVRNVHEAVVNVLGMENTLNTMIGSLFAGRINMPETGRAGRKAMWRHALNVAMMCMKMRYEVERLLDADTAYQCYLAGLLHNIGYFVIAHLEPVAYREFARQAEQNPDVDLDDLASTFFGMSHQEVGATLLSHWNIPHGTVAAIRDQHAGSDPAKAPLAWLIASSSRAIALANKVCSGQHTANTEVGTTRLTAAEDIVQRAMPDMAESD